MAEPFVEVRARSRFLAYGQSPVGDWEREVWTLRVPAAWVEGLPPGASSPELTKRCQEAVRRQAGKWRAEAIAMAERSAAEGGDYDAGHSIVEPAAVRRFHSWELDRRPWTQGRLRFFYVVDASGHMRPGTEADLPRLTALTPFQESVFAGWREEQVERWREATACYAEALRRADAGSEPALLSEADSSLARVKERIAAIERAAVERAAAEKRARKAAAERPAPIPVDPKAPGPRQASEGIWAMKHSGFPDAIEKLHAALDEDLPDGSVVSRAETLFHLGVALEHENRLEESQARLRSALAQLEKGPRGVSQPLVMEAVLARVLARSGPAHAAEARAILDRTAPLVLATDAEGHHCWASALLHHAAGDRVAALAAIDRAVELYHHYFIYGLWVTSDRATIAGPA